MEWNKDAYENYVKEITPVNALFGDMVRAFVTGGLICALGQAVVLWLTEGVGMDPEEAKTWMQLGLIFLSVLLTGAGQYAKLVKWGGAGALVPITGFANSVAAPAIEYKAEGHVFGIGVKIFTIAGPVILFGILSSWALGMAYWLGQMLGWVPA